MSDEVEACARREQTERDRDELDDLVEAARSRGAQERFELREREFNRIAIRTVRGQKAEARADAGNRGVHGGLFVDGEIVEDHHVVWPERPAPNTCST